MSDSPVKTPGAVLYTPIVLASLGLTFLAFGLPIYARALNASALEIGGLYSVFMLATLILRPVSGWAQDRFGRKAHLIAGLAGYALAMGLFAIAGNLAGLYLARLVNGIAAAFTWTSSSTIVADLATSGERGKAMGAVNMMSTRGQIIGALAGFTLMNMLPPGQGWQAVFSGFALMAALGAWLAWKNVPETCPAVLVTEKLTKQWRFSRSFAWLLIIVLTTSLSQAMVEPQYLIFLQDHFTKDIGTLAFAFLPAGILLSILPARLGALSDRFGRAPFMALGLLGSGLLFLALPGMSALTPFILLYTLSAVGWSLSIPAEAALVGDLTDGEQLGKGYGMYQFAGSLGAMIGYLVGGWVYDAIGPASSFHVAGMILLVSAAGVMVTLRALPQQVKKVEITV